MAAKTSRGWVPNNESHEVTICMLSNGTPPHATKAAAILHNGFMSPHKQVKITIICEDVPKKEKKK